MSAPKLLWLVALGMVWSLNGCGGHDAPAASAVLDTSAEAASLQFSHCYPVATFELCIPAIGKGSRILARADGSSSRAIAAQLTARTGIAATATALTTPSSDAERELLAHADGFTLYDVSGYFPSFLRERFNTSANFSGPNCYNTALIAAGLIPDQPLRHVSLPEYEVYLSEYFERVATPQWGDVIVFDANGTRDHTAVYLFDGLIFHKKGYNKGYRYRITALETAFAVEPYEWQPSPLSGTAPALTTDLSKAPRAIYRRKVRQTPVAPSLAADDQAAMALADYISNATFAHAPQWKVGTVMGTMMEGVAARLLHDFASLKSNTRLDARLSYQRLQSANDQIYVAIDDAFFSSPFADSRRINRDYCWQAGAFLDGLIAQALTYTRGQAPDSADVKHFITTQLAPMDRERCQIDLLALARASVSP